MDMNLCRSCIERFTKAYYLGYFQNVHYYSQEIEHIVLDAISGHQEHNRSDNFRSIELSAEEFAELLESRIPGSQDEEDRGFYVIALGTQAHLLEIFGKSWTKYALRALTICDEYYQACGARERIALVPFLIVIANFILRHADPPSIGTTVIERIREEFASRKADFEPYSAALILTPYLTWNENNMRPSMCLCASSYKPNRTVILLVLLDILLSTARDILSDEIISEDKDAGEQFLGMLVTWSGSVMPTKEEISQDELDKLNVWEKKCRHFSRLELLQQTQEIADELLPDIRKCLLEISSNRHGELDSYLPKLMIGIKFLHALHNIGYKEFMAQGNEGQSR